MATKTLTLDQTPVGRAALSLAARRVPMTLHTTFGGFDVADLIQNPDGTVTIITKAGQAVITTASRLNGISTAAPPFDSFA